MLLHFTFILPVYLINYIIRNIFPSGLCYPDRLPNIFSSLHVCKAVYVRLLA